MEKSYNFRKISYQFLWVFLLVIGFAGFLIVWFLMPHKQEIDTPLQVIFKILIFLVIIASIGFFPNKAKWEYILLLVPIMAYLTYMGPKISYYGFIELHKDQAHIFSEFYTLLYLLLFPMILMSICFSYRIGGGTPGNTIKIGTGGVIILFSGYLDLLWYVINPVGIPDVIQYAHHIKMVIGHYPKYWEGVIFCVCHIPFLVGVILLPLDKWFKMIFNEEYK